SPVAVARGCRPWLSPVAVARGCRPWLSSCSPSPGPVARPRRPAPSPGPVARPRKIFGILFDFVFLHCMLTMLRETNNEARGNDYDGCNDCPVCVVYSVCVVYYPGFLPAPILTISPNTTIVRGETIMTALQATLDCAVVTVFDVWVENAYHHCRNEDGEYDRFIGYT